MSCIEPLEARSYFASVVGITLAGANDLVLVSLKHKDPGTLIVETNGKTTTYAVSAVSGLNVDLGGGKDFFKVNTHNGAIDIPMTINGGSGNDNITTGDGRDSVVGGPGSDRVNGKGGNDSLSGGTGNDSIYGGGGSDVITGASGDDQLFGDGEEDITREKGSLSVRLDASTAGSDTISGGAGDDIIMGVFGVDSVNGDAGNDTIQVAGISKNNDSDRVAPWTAEAEIGSLLTDVLFVNPKALA